MTKKAVICSIVLSALVVVVGVRSNKAVAMDSMMMAQKWDKANVMWAPQAGAKKYNVYFTEKDSWMKNWKWNHSVRNIPVSDKGMREVTVGYLKPGVTYVAKVSAVGWNGKEFWWSPEMTLKTMPM